MNKQKCSHET